jgi:hypothetical protein
VNTLKRIATTTETRKLEKLIRATPAKRVAKARKAVRMLQPLIAPARREGVLPAKRLATAKEVRGLEQLMRAMPLLAPPLPSRPGARA